MHFHIYEVQKQAEQIHGVGNQKQVASWRAGRWGLDWKEVGGNSGGCKNVQYLVLGGGYRMVCVFLFCIYIYIYIHTHIYTHKLCILLFVDCISVKKNDLTTVQSYLLIMADLDKDKDSCPRHPRFMVPPLLCCVTGAEHLNQDFF